MDLFHDFSDSDDGTAPAPAPAPAPASSIDRHLQLSRAREARAAKARRRAQNELAEARVQLAQNGSAEARGNKWCRRLSFKDMVDLAYQSSAKCSALASQFKVSKRHVLRVATMVAAEYLRLQLLLLGALVARARSSRPVFFGSRLAWDETGERVTLQVPGATQEQQNSVWHVLVSRLKLVVAWSRPDGVLQPFTIALVLPTLVVPSTSAASIFSQLFHHPLNAAIFTAVRELSELSTFATKLYETDAAYANQRLTAHLFTTAEANDLMCHWLCSLHQLQLVESAVTACVGRKCNLIAKLYSLTLLLRSGGSFMNMVSRLRGMIQDSCVVRHGPAELEAKEYSHEVARYLLTHYKRFSECQGSFRSRMPEPGPGSESEDEREFDFEAQEHPFPMGKGLANFFGWVKEFLAVYNGAWWSSGVLVHHCRGCCRSQEHTLERMEAAAKHVAFREMPATPALNKWTKLGPCCDVVLFGMLWHQGFLNAFGRLALGDLRAHAAAAAAAGADAGEPVDTQYLNDLSFSAVQGRRYNMSASMLRDAASVVALTVLSLVLEPLRFVSSWLMRRARENEDPRALPPILDMWFSPRSPICIASQYLATMLMTPSTPRLMFLWRPAACSSAQEWCERRTADMRTLRRAILHAACWLHRRFTCRMREFPWKLVSLSDHRVPQAERAALANSFMTANPCCLHPGFARRLQSRVTEADLQSPPWSHIWVLFARLLTLQCADVEWRHGRNRSRSQAYGQSAFTHFTARYVNAEAQVLHKAREELKGLLRQGLGGSAGVAQASQAPLKKSRGHAAVTDHVRTPSAADLFRYERIKREKMSGQVVRCVSKEFHRETKAEFESLPEDVKSNYHQQVDLLRAVAKENRHEAKRRRLQVDSAGALPARPPQAGPSAPLPPQAAQPLGLQLVPCSMIAALGVASASEATGQSQIAGGPFEVALQDRQDDLNAEGPQPPQPHPMTPLMMQRACARGGMESVAQSFGQKANFVRQPVGPEQQFPNRVQYPRHCGELCMHESPWATRAWFLSLKVALLRCAQRFGSPVDLPLLDVVLAIEVHKQLGGPADAVHFVAMAASSSRSGQHDPTQTFVEFNRVAGELNTDLTGLRLQFASRAYVPLRRRVRSPMNRNTVGALSCLSEEELIMQVLGSVQPDGQPIREVPSCVARVLIRRLRYHDATLGAIVTDGVDESFEAVELDRPIPQQRPPLAQRRCSAFDLCREVMGETADSHGARPRRQQAQPQQPHADPLLADDPGQAAVIAGYLGELGLDGSGGAEAEEDLEEEDPFDINAELEQIMGVLAGGPEEPERASSSDGDNGDDEGAEESGEGAVEASADHDERPWFDQLLHERSPWNFSSAANGSDVGRIHEMGAGSSLKATCRVHQDCVCWVSLTHRSDDLGDKRLRLAADLREWLASALPGQPHAQKCQHQERARTLKQSWGMRVRK